MVATEQNAENERRQSIWRNEDAIFRFEKGYHSAVAQNEQSLGDNELNKDCAKNQEQPRRARKGLGLIDPELRDCGDEK